MKNKVLALVLYTFALAVDFYLLPLMITSTGSAMLLMLFAVPLIAFICSVFYGVRQGFSFLLPIIAVILFAPTIFIFYDVSAWVYIISYAAVVLIGNGIGCIFYKKR